MNVFGKRINKRSIDPYEENIKAMYHQFRAMMLWLAVLFPLILGLGGKLLGIDWQSSISHYLAPTNGDQFVDGWGYILSRGMFTGGLWALGLLLIVYKGYSRAENIALNLAGVFAMGVALLPFQISAAGPNPMEDSSFYPHWASAILMFASVFYVGFFRAGDTLQHSNLPTAQVAWYRRTYQAVSSIMAVAVVVGTVFGLFTVERFNSIFWAEAVAIWSFGVFWYFKNREMLAHSPLAAQTGSSPIIESLSPAPLTPEVSLPR